MGFGNGYDSGYSDALEDVRNGKVPGIGPAPGGGGAAPAPTTRTPGLFYLYGIDETLETDFNVPDVMNSNVINGAVLRSVTFTTNDNGLVVAHVAAPTGGWVPGDAVIFHHNNSELAGIDRGDTVPDDSTATGNMSTSEIDLMLIRRTDRWSLVPLTLFG